VSVHSCTSMPCTICDDGHWPRRRLYASVALGNGPNPFRGKVLDDVELAQALAYERQATQADLNARARYGLLANSNIGQAQMNAMAAKWAVFAPRGTFGPDVVLRLGCFNEVSLTPREVQAGGGLHIVRNDAAWAKALAPLPKVPCDICGAMCEEALDWVMMELGVDAVDAVVVYRCAACDPERGAKRVPLPRESWWLRALRWLAKL
jgi:hypothetical protein